MIKSIRLAGLALAATVLFAGSQAAALDAPCLWSALPQARQTTFTGHFEANGLGGLRNLPFNDSDISIWMSRCAVTEASSEAAGYILGTYVMENSALLVLERDYGAKPAAVRKAWSATPVAQRNATRDALKATLAGGPQTDALPSLVTALLQQLGLNEDARGQVTYFALGQLARELKLAEVAG